LPTALARAYPGPKFGINGTRRLAGVSGHPLIGTIIKPSVGLSAERTGILVGHLALAGIDFVKDDELQSDGPACPFKDRVRAVMRRVNDAADKTGKKTMVAFNLTGEIDGLEVALKGGQMGSKAFFIEAKLGHIAQRPPSSV